MSMIERVARAVDAAQCHGREGPYGLYDYSGYEGSEYPHVVRDFRFIGSDTYGGTIARFNDSREAQALYDKLTREHIARAAIEAMREPTKSMVAAGVKEWGFDYSESQDGINKNISNEYRSMIDAALAEVSDA